MADNSNSVLVIGFNTRPLAYSLKKAGYLVYVVDFFGDVDLYPLIEDFIIVMNEVKENYDSLKEKYSKYLVQFGLKLLRKHQNMNFLLIGSGLDDEYVGRKLLLNEIKDFNTQNVNNDLEVIKKSRDIDYLYKLLKLQGYHVPDCRSLEYYKLKEFKLKYPFILKKKGSAGGINIYKIKNKSNFLSQVKILEKKLFIPSEWMIQEYIEGIPVSCTVISNGKDGEVISINRQIIGEKSLNPPKEFMYCGNIVPAGLLKEEEAIISEISLFLTKKLGLKGINGFDFVIKNHYPYLMECNPRIPGSIRASESVLNLNLLDLNIRSFMPKEWKTIKNLINSAIPYSFATKLIFFAPKVINKKLLPKINTLKYIHDKSEPKNNILKGEPLCTILYKAKNLSESYNGAIEIVNEIKRIIG